MREHAPHGPEKNHHSHDHTHGSIDPSLIATEQGFWAIQRSCAVLVLTAILQMIVVYFSGSIALLADTIHNIGDAATAIPLGIAFSLSKKKPTKRFTYGYGRVEDLAGVIIVFMILASAVVAGYESIDRFFHPQKMTHLGAVIFASIIGFLGNEAVAIFRIKVGKEIGSAALVADGYHARIDGFTSLAVLAGTLGVWMGYPLADPMTGLLITVVILKIVWDSAKLVFTRLLDGVEPEIIDEIRHAVTHVPQVHEVTEVRARWIGHRIHAELNIAIASDLSVEQAHQIAQEVRRELLDHLRYLSNAIIHVDPLNASGETYHPHS
ncbi:MAG: cation transporter [Candidatus Omnitrophica bacterium]|nr:cation transporter [Candidatus Omnitrophota bacterium]